MNRKKQLDFTLGMLFIGGSLPFNLVDSIYFKTFVNLLDPEYKIPCRQTLSTTIVEGIHNGITQSLKTSYGKSNGTLMIDGWKNSSNNTKTVTAIIKLHSGKEIFVKSYNFSDIPENHLNLLEVVTESSRIAKELFDVTFNAMTTDNAANMIKTGKETNLIAYGCKAHAGNLYLNDVHDASLYAEVHKIMVLFKHTRLQANVRSSGGSSIYLAGETRWKVRNKFYKLRCLNL